MQKMAVKKIIIPTDFSESAYNAVRFAVGIFGLQRVEYTLLNCYALPHTGTEMLISLTDILRLESDEGLENMRNDLVSEIPGLAPVLKSRCENGFLDTVLHKIARKEHPDLVVMGTKGSRGMVKLLWGSNTATVMRRVKTPILAVPLDAEPKPALRHITLALQQEKIAGFEYPRLLLQLLEEQRASLSIVSVDEQPVAAQTATARAVGSDINGFTTNHVNITDSDPVQGILNYLDSTPSDLLVMVAREYGLLKKMFHHSSTQAMAMMSNIPLLVLREK